MNFLNNLYMYIRMNIFKAIYFRLKKNKIKLSNLTNKIEMRDKKKKLNYKKVKIIVDGKNNLIIFFSNLKLRNLKINIEGNNNSLILYSYIRI